MVTDESSRSLKITKASAYNQKATPWAWDNRIPLGELTLLAGRENQGKSTFAAYLAAQLSQGQLEGDLYGTPYNTIISATEDRKEQTIIPRLVANGADLERVGFVEAEVRESGYTYPVSFPQDLALFAERLAEGDVKFFIMDPLISRMEGTVNKNTEDDVRSVLEPLVLLCHEYGVAMIGLTHLNKGRGIDILTKVMASRAFTAVPRSVMAIIQHPEDKRTKIFGVPKGNLMRCDEHELTQSFTIVNTQTGMDGDQPITAGRIEMGDYLGETLDQILEGSHDESNSPGGKAQAWLKRFILSHGGRVASKMAKEAAAEEGISESTLDRARKSLGYQSEQVRMGDNWRYTEWIVPEEPALPQGMASTDA